MVLYFSGTGNSEYVAKRMGAEIQDETLNLFEKIRNHDHSEIYSPNPWVIVTPVYAWRIPRILGEWLLNTKLLGNKDIYFVITCGGSIGNAWDYVERLCTLKGLNFMGCSSIVMPDNYIVLFQMPEHEKALEIINQAEEIITNVSQLMKSEKTFPKPSIALKDRINSGLVNPFFYSKFVRAKKFYATDDCISCGKCEKLCPLKNIHLEKGKPAWGNQCTHCMACICLCPKEAIEYGKHSKGKLRYRCPIKI